MAKAKQSKSDDKPAKKPAAAAKPAAKSGGSAKPAAKKAGGGSSSHAPSIDTNLAASAAASMILSRATGATGGGTSSPATAGGAAQPAKKETSTFKQLKQNLAKPSAPGGLLSNTAAQKKAGNLPFGGGQQKGHNQTFGADVNRAGVPRRTGGG